MEACRFEQHLKCSYISSQLQDKEKNSMKMKSEKSLNKGWLMSLLWKKATLLLSRGKIGHVGPSNKRNVSINLQPGSCDKVLHKVRPRWSIVQDLQSKHGLTCRSFQFPKRYWNFFMFPWPVLRLHSLSIMMHQVASNCSSQCPLDLSSHQNLPFFCVWPFEEWNSVNTKLLTFPNGLCLSTKSLSQKHIE